MIQTIFGFRGQLGRLAFIGWSVGAAALVFVIAFGFLVIGGLMAGFASPEGLGPKIMGITMALVSAVVGIWATLALQAKRLRDMAFNPLPWMVGVTIALCLDQWVLARFLELRFFPPFSQYTPVGGLLTFAYMTMLLLWPSAAAPDASSRPQERPAPARPDLTVQRMAASRPQFGRR